MVCFAVDPKNKRRPFNMEILYENLLQFQWQDMVMILLGCLLIFLAIKKEMEPSLLLPMGLGTILVNIPGVATAMFGDELVVGSSALVGPILELYEAGIGNELRFYQILNLRKYKYTYLSPYLKL